jgi:predicted ribosome quality control (RQC) complex YloA/Tae2 family protein
VAARRVFRTTEGGQIMVGRSARENDYLTFDEARPDDLWLHARGIPGAHVILKPARAPASDEDIEAAAGVAAYYSAGRGSGKVPVDVTQRRFVRRVRGGRPGQVHYTDERTLLVAPGLPGTSR